MKRQRHMPTAKEYLRYVINRIHAKASNLPRDQYLTNTQMEINHVVLREALKEIAQCH